MSYEACGVGENIIVDVCIFHGRVGILPEAIEEEDYAEGDGRGEDEEGAREEGRHFDPSGSGGTIGSQKGGFKDPREEVKSAYRAPSRVLRNLEFYCKTTTV
jgi:hypothetical protein